MTQPIYLDYAATTPVDARVAEKMCHFMTHDGHFGNPASTHGFGKVAREAVEEARQQVADLIHAESSEIIWTSGATEANNLALKGVAQLYQSKGKHIITLKTEHPSVLDTCQQLEKQGFFITYLSPERNGLLDLEKLQAALRAETILVSIMHVNNETGVMQDIKKIAELTSSRGILFHTDAAQSAGKLPLNMQEIPIDLLSFCGHKIYGPKGIGVLYVRRKPRVRVAPQIHGGGQEQGMRSGTLPTHQIVGLGAAVAIAKQIMREEYHRIQQLRERFWQGIHAINNKVAINGDLNITYPGILNIRFENKKADALLQKLPELAISMGSACHSKGIEPSYVLRAMGLSDELAKQSLRFSFGRFTNDSDIDFAIKHILGVGGE